MAQYYTTQSKEDLKKKVKDKIGKLDIFHMQRGTIPLVSLRDVYKAISEGFQIKD